VEKKIDIINNWNLKRVFDELENGNMKIPKFQRGYVWERTKIVHLLNSIYKQYPIGSFFIWTASKEEYTNFTREIEGLNLPKNPYSNEYSFILDGQQRITSLYVALKGKTLNNTDYSTICFNVEKGVFQIPRLKTEKHNIPAYKLFDTAEYGNVLPHYVKKLWEKKYWRKSRSVRVFVFGFGQALWLMATSIFHLYNKTFLANRQSA
jgi:hypothetical protein